jgi:hypothetical protein
MYKQLEKYYINDWTSRKSQSSKNHTHKKALEKSITAKYTNEMNFLTGWTLLYFEGSRGTWKQNNKTYVIWRTKKRLQKSDHRPRHLWGKSNLWVNYGGLKVNESKKGQKKMFKK